MIIKYLKTQVFDADAAARRAGYGLKQDRSGEKSYTRHPDRTMLYPRYHMYIKDGGDSWLFNLHLDQRAPVYQGQTAHGGEYDGDAVEREGERIKNILNKNPTE